MSKFVTRVFRKKTKLTTRFIQLEPHMKYITFIITIFAATSLFWACGNASDGISSKLPSENITKKSDLLQARWRLEFTVPNTANMQPSIIEYNKYGEILQFNEKINDFSFQSLYRLHSDTINPESLPYDYPGFSIIKQISHDSLILEVYAQVRDIATGYTRLTKAMEEHYSNFNHSSEWALRRTKFIATPEYSQNLAPESIQEQKVYAFLVIASVDKTGQSFAEGPEIIVSSISEIHGNFDEEKQYIFKDKGAAYMNQFLGSDRKNAGTHVIIRNTYVEASKARDSIPHSREIAFDYSK